MSGLRGTRLLKETLKVVTVNPTLVWDEDLGRNKTVPGNTTIHTFNGSYQSALRIEPPVPSNLSPDQRAVVRGSVRAAPTTALTTALATPGVRIQLEDGNYVTPVQKPKGMGGSGNRLRIDCGDFV